MKNYEMISIDQALIMALRIHDRGDCGLVRALLTGFELRYQINWLTEMGISRQDFESLIDRPRDILEAWK